MVAATARSETVVVAQNEDYRAYTDHMYMYMYLNVLHGACTTGYRYWSMYLSTSNGLHKGETSKLACVKPRARRAS